MTQAPGLNCLSRRVTDETVADRRSLWLSLRHASVTVSGPAGPFGRPVPAGQAGMMRLLRKQWGLAALCLAFLVPGYPAAPDPAASPAVLLSLADAELARGAKDRAARHYEEYIDAAGFSQQAARVLVTLARIRHAGGDLAGFMRARNRHRTWFPADRETVRMFDELEASLLFGVAEYGKAADLVSALLRRHDYPADIADRWAAFQIVCHERSARPDLALEGRLALVRSGRKTPQVADALFNVAQWALGKGNRELALFYVNRLLSEHPSWANLAQARALKRSIRWRMITVADGLGDDSVSTIRFDGDDVWVGTWLGGITRYSRSQGRFQHYTVKNSDLVSDLIRDLWIEGSRVWTATFEGLSWFDKRTDAWQTVLAVAGLAYQRVKCVLTHEKTLWVGTIGNGVSAFDLRTEQWRSWGVADGLPDANIVTIAATPGSVWAGALAGGIARYDIRDGGRWRTWNNAAGSPVANVKAMVFDGQRLWIATHGGGLLSCDERGNDWRRYTRANSGLPSDFVHAVTVAADGRIWVGTLEGGAASFDQKTGAWKVIDIRDGLPGNDVTTIAFEGRSIWFGTLNGGIAVLLTDE